MDIVAAAGELAAFDPVAADRRALEDGAALSARVRAWLDGFDVEVGRALEVKTGYGAKVLADAANVSLASGERVIERGRTLTVLPAIEAALKAGDVSAAHVDAATRALRQVPEARRGELAAIIDGLVGDARSLPPNEFERRLRVEVRRLQGDDSARQKRSIRWRSWVERISGMFRGDFVCDSLNAVKIDKRIQDEVDRLFAERVPDECPDDPIEKQKFLAGLAVISLLLGNGGGVGKPELVVVVDATQLDEDGKPTVDWGLPVDLSSQVLAEGRGAGEGTHRGGVAASRPRPRAPPAARQRHAAAGVATIRRVRSRGVRCGSVAQKMHHVWWWDHGGPTDLDNLLPVCSRHHHAVHDQGWQLKLLADRTLEVTLPDGTTMETGPSTRGP